LTGCAEVASAVALDPSCSRRAEAPGERRLAAEPEPERFRAELDAFLVAAAPALFALEPEPERVRAELDAFLVAAAPALFALEPEPERFRAELDAFLVAAAPALLEPSCLLEERDELPLGLFGVAIGLPRSGTAIG
jgi:hypothetical protein